MKYSHKDFEQNPSKYRIFSTAVIAKHVFTNNGEHDLVAGEYVGIQYLRTARNMLYKRDEPVYLITKNGALWGHIYANCLEQFVI